VAVVVFRHIWYLFGIWCFRLSQLLSLVSLASAQCSPPLRVELGSVRVRVLQELLARIFFCEFALTLAQGLSGHPFEDALFRISPYVAQIFAQAKCVCFLPAEKKKKKKKKPLFSRKPFVTASYCSPAVYTLGSPWRGIFG
jgi:hypothetical protein